MFIGKYRLRCIERTLNIMIMNNSKMLSPTKYYFIIFLLKDILIATKFVVSHKCDVSLFTTLKRQRKTC